MCWLNILWKRVGGTGDRTHPHPHTHTKLTWVRYWHNKTTWAVPPSPRNTGYWSGTKVTTWSRIWREPTPKRNSKKPSNFGKPSTKLHGIGFSGRITTNPVNLRLLPRRCRSGVPLLAKVGRRYRSSNDLLVFLIQLPPLLLILLGRTGVLIWKASPQSCRFCKTGTWWGFQTAYGNHPPLLNLCVNIVKRRSDVLCSCYVFIYSI